MVARVGRAAHPEGLALSNLPNNIWLRPADGMTSLPFEEP
jgi:hypothetical protein